MNNKIFIVIIIIFSNVSFFSLCARENGWLDSVSKNIHTYLYKVETTHYYIDGIEYGI